MVDLSIVSCINRVGGNIVAELRVTDTSVCVRVCVCGHPTPLVVLMGGGGGGGGGDNIP